MDEHGGNGGIDAAGESADHASVADLLADGFDGFVDEALRRPVGREAADVEDEVAQDGSSLLGVVDFGMELHGVVLARGIFEGGLGVGGLRDEMEAGRKLFGFVAVGHPDVQRAGESFEEGAVVAQQFDVGVSVLALVAGADFAAELLRHEVQAVTDAQHRKAEVQHLVVHGGGVGFVDGRRASGEDDASGRVALDFFQRGGAGENDGEDVLFADAARDELGVLRAEVEDDDRLVSTFYCARGRGKCKAE